SSRIYPEPLASLRDPSPLEMSFPSMLPVPLLPQDRRAGLFLCTISALPAFAEGKEHIPPFASGTENAARGRPLPSLGLHLSPRPPYLSPRGPSWQLPKRVVLAGQRLSSARHPLFTLRYFFSIFISSCFSKWHSVFILLLF